jgi:hypothetical protein
MSGTKFRPALGLHKSEHDEVVAFISSKFPVYLQDSDILVSKDPSILPLSRAQGLFCDKI